MLLLFKVCFGVGIGYTVLAFLLGEVIHFGDFGGSDGDLDFDLDSHVPGDAGSISPLKPACIAAFITVFGGCGILFLPRFGGLLAVMMASLLGAIVAFLIFRFIIVPLNRAQNTSAVEKQSLIGSNAVVTERIPQGHFGKITYFVNGNTYSAPAKSEDGNEIARNSNVEITHIEKNTYFVALKERA
ncbi:MAG: hypothetical protein LBU94_04375 [Clostridiales bacterium]|jgi:membrane protein implicated in regulation of membrane protease activity|nr:hypothetical protein [Clostridiales bacterium]